MKLKNKSTEMLGKTVKKISLNVKSKELKGHTEEAGPPEGHIANRSPRREMWQMAELQQTLCTSECLCTLS